MKSQALLTLAKYAAENLPDSPGVYFFMKKAGTRGSRSRSDKYIQNTKNEILYIGRATSLRDRVISYFKDNLLETRGPLITTMLARTDSIEWQETGSVLEAIILESNLIKKYQPKHNTQEKDDRSYNYVVITDEDFPRVMLMRGRELNALADGKIKNVKIKEKFGPYPQGNLLREALSIIRKIFPFRDGRAHNPHNEAFYRSIGLSPDISSPKAKKEYIKTIRHLVLFFEGKKKALIKSLEREMKAYATIRQFEKADYIKHTLYALGHIQDVSLIKKNSIDSVVDDGLARTSGIFRIEAYDVAHFSGSENVGAMIVIENGEPNKDQYRKFKISRDINDDTSSLSEMLRRRFNHPEWPLPNLIVVDGGIGQINAAEKIKKSMASNIPIVSVVKDDRHKAKNIMKGNRNILDNVLAKHTAAIFLANAEAHRFAVAFHRRRLSKKMLD
jgi:excinuclease ABC subunit C